MISFHYLHYHHHRRPNIVLLLLAGGALLFSRPTTVTEAAAFSSSLSSHDNSIIINHDNHHDDYEAVEPFPFLHSYNPHGLPTQPVQESPDPLVTFAWDAAVNISQLQVYRVLQPVDYQVLLVEQEDKEDKEDKVEDKNCQQLVATPRKTNHGFLVDITTSTTSLASFHRDTTHPVPNNDNYKGSVQLDWGVERAAWLELVLLTDENTVRDWNITLTGSISEFNVPQKTLPFQKHGQHTYRLEPNPELYEGVRFTWIHWDIIQYLHLHDTDTDTTTHPDASSASASSWNPTKLNNLNVTIGVSLVAKIKPVNYTGMGHFETTTNNNHASSSSSSSSSSLTNIWCTGAYGVRLNMESNQFNTVLVERGDRVSILGTNHPVMATAMVAFGTNQVYELIHDELWRTNAGHVHGNPDNVIDHEIIVYDIYWTLSVNEWYYTTGDTDRFLHLAPDVMSLLDDRIRDFLDPNLNLVWMAWDDRLGDGWCAPQDCGVEAKITFAAILIRACRDFGYAYSLATTSSKGSKGSKGSSGGGSHAARNGTDYIETAFQLGKQLRQFVMDQGYWMDGLGVHSAANIINAGNTIAQNEDEINQLFQRYLNNSITICSLCNFDQYWVLQGLGNVGGGGGTNPWSGAMDHALASIQLCWGTSRAMGKGCFWEMYSPEWQTFLKDGDQAPIGISYCHPWAAGVSAWMSHNVGGIQALLPGYELLMVTPHVSPRFPVIQNVTVPTPFGPTSVWAQWKRKNIGNDNDNGGLLQMTIEMPNAGYAGLRLLIPADGKVCALKESSVTLNDVPVPVKSMNDTIAAATGKPRLQMALSRRFVPSVANALRFLPIDRPGRHIISAQYAGDCNVEFSSLPLEAREYPNNVRLNLGAKREGIPHFPPFPKPDYPASVFLDRYSAGDGISKYGTEGYVLLGFINGGDLIKLPKYIANVTVCHHNYNGWTSLPRTFLGESDNNKTFLPDPRGGSTKRALGILGEDYQFLGRGTILDIDVEEGELAGRSFTVSGYAVAPQPNEKYALRVQDRHTLDIIAPNYLISNHSQGIWWSVQYRRSVRIRLVAITGAHLSAIAFGDPALMPGHPFVAQD